MQEPLDSIVDLRVFAAAARSPNLSSAARDLGLSLTSVSRRLQRLEAQLGVRLVHRSSRQLRLTEEGCAFRLRCADILERLDAAIEDAGTGLGQPSGVLRVTCSSSFGQHQIAPRLGAFFDLYPDITVQLMATDASIDLIAQNVDVAIRQARTADSTLITRQLVPDINLLCASPAYVARHGLPETPDALARHRCIVVGDPPVTRWQLHRGEAVVAIDVTPALRSTSGEAAFGAMLAGVGIAWRSEWEVAHALASGALVRVLPDWAGEPRSIQLLYPARTRQPARTRAFVAFIEAELRRDAARLDLGSQRRAAA